jgi:hypothetical protein
MSAMRLHPSTSQPEHSRRLCAVALFRTVGLCFALCLGACGTQVPSESDGEADFLGRISGPLASHLQVKSFKKTDGQKSEFGGVAIYTLEFEALVEFDTVASYDAEDSLRVTTLQPSFSSGVELTFRDFWEATKNAVDGWQPAFRGDRLKLTGAIQFQLKESGWVPSGIEYRPALDTLARKR